MHKRMWLAALPFLSLTLCAAQQASVQTAKGKATKGAFTDTELKQFVALDVIDTHTHVFHPSPRFNEMVQRLNLHLIDILVMDDHEKHSTLDEERASALSVIQQNKDRMRLCTTFDPYQFNTPGFTENAIRGIDTDFADGAIAVKIWKNVGMEIKNRDGKYVLPDDPAFEPIYKDIAAHNKTLIAHLADPNTLWAPPNPKADDYSYYMYENPWWYMYNKPGVNSKEEILRARDHILEANPSLRVVGAHLGSLEADFDDLADHLDRYPNFAVDLAGRVPYFEMLPREKAIAFIVKYQDRLIYATDNDHDFDSPRHAARSKHDWEVAYANQWRFFATDDIIEYQGKNVRGLALPVEILRKLYHDNAVKWFPGVLGSS